MMMTEPHPRLYVTETDFERLKGRALPKWLASYQTWLEADAETFLDTAGIDDFPGTHNGHLIRARRLRNRVLTLLVRWRQSGEARYRAAAFEQVAHLGTWREWSWIAWRRGLTEPDAVFDLSCGENSATLALAYDWMYESLTDAERATLLAIASERSFAAYLNEAKPIPDTWYERKDSNWNTVCAGGAGMLALAMAEELPMADAVLERTERSVVPYFDHVEENGGGWPEGIGYWRYGMDYGLMYLLSWSHAMGRMHPLLKRPGLKKSLAFPLYFSPNGAPASFGDSGGFRPAPVHRLVARRLKQETVVYELDRRLADDAAAPRTEAAQWVLLHDRRHAASSAAEKPFAVHYRNMDWYVLADRMPRPALTVTVRGGTTEVPHGHMDLASFQCVVGDEPLLANIGVKAYFDTTFGPRRYELFETTPPSKNVILVNGVGITRPACVVSSLLRVGGIPAVRIDATEAMGMSRDSDPAMRFCGRLVMVLDRHAVLVVDRVETEHNAAFESRLHSVFDVTCRKDAAVITGQRNTASVRFATIGDAVLQTASPALTDPGVYATTLRWLKTQLATSEVFATLITSGAHPGEVTLSCDAKRLRIAVRYSRTRKTLLLTRNLKPTG